jgi:hypothetical protein
MVSFRAQDGSARAVEVTAETLYEAAALALGEFKRSEWDLGGIAPASVLEVRIKPPVVTHTVSVRSIYSWLEGVSRSPRERLVKERVKGLLQG